MNFAFEMGGGGSGQRKKGKREEVHGGGGNETGGVREERGGGRGSYLPREDRFLVTYRAHGYVLRILISHEALTCS